MNIYHITFINWLFFIRNIPPVTFRQVTSKSQVDKNLHSATHVFIKNNTRSGIQPNYITGHTKYSKEKYFKEELTKGPDTISVDRLKVAYYDE